MNKYTKRVLIAFAVVVAAVILLYVLVSRPFFVRTFILPKIANKTGLSIEVENIKFRPLSSIALHGVSFRRANGSLKGTIEEFSCHYSAMSFATGNPRIDNLKITNGDGRYNRPRRDDAPPLDLFWEKTNCEITDIARNQTAQLKIAADLHGLSKEKWNLKTARFTADGTMKLSDELFPSKTKLEALLTNLDGFAGKVPLTNRKATFTVSIESTPETWSVKNSSLVLFRGSARDLRATITGNGTLTPLTGNVKIDADPVSSHALNLAGSFYHNLEFGKGTAEYHGAVAYDEKGNISLQGKLALHNAQVSSAELGLTGLPLIAANLEHNISYNPSTKKSRIQALASDLVMDGRQVATLKLADPMTLQIPDAEKQTLSFTPSNVALKIDRLPLKLANLVLSGPDNPKIRDGTLTADIKTAINRQGESIELTGPVNVKAFALSFPGQSTKIEQVNIKYRFDISMTNKENIELKPVAIDVSVEDKPVTSITPALKYNLADKSGDYSVNLHKLTPAISKLLPPDMLAATPIMRLGANGIVEGTFNLNQPTGTVEYNLEVPELQFAVRDYGPTVPVNSMLNGKIRFTNNQVTLTANKIDAMAESNRLAHLIVDGNVAIPLANGKSELSISSEGMDLQSLSVIANMAADIRRQVAPPPEEEPEPVEPPITEKVIPPGTNAIVHLDLRNLIFRAVSVQSCKGDVTIQNQTIKTDGLALQINGAPMKIRGLADVSTSPTRFDLESSLGSLPLDPILNSFELYKAQSILDASIKSVSLKAAGRGFTLPELKQSLTGNAEMSLDVLAIQGWNKLTELAQRYNIPELESLIFNQAHAAAEIRNGRIALRETRLAGENLKINIDGAIGLDRTLDLATDLAVGGQLADRLVSQGYGPALNAPENGYRALPFAIPIGGTWTQPKPDFSLKRLLQEAAKAKGKDLIKGTIKQLEQGKEPDFKDILEGVLGGDKKESTTKPQEKPSSEDQKTTEKPEDQTKNSDALNEKSTEDQLRDTGLFLLRELLKNKDEKQPQKPSEQQQ